MKFTIERFFPLEEILDHPTSEEENLVKRTLQEQTRKLIFEGGFRKIETVSAAAAKMRVTDYEERVAEVIEKSREIEDQQTGGKCLGASGNPELDTPEYLTVHDIEHMAVSHLIETSGGKTAISGQTLRHEAMHEPSESLVVIVATDTPEKSIQKAIGRAAAAANRTSLQTRRHPF